MKALFAAYVAAGLATFWIGVVALFVDTHDSGWWFLAAAACWAGAWWMVRDA